MAEVYLSDGKPFSVRTLGIFELDVIERQDLGPFLYPMDLMGDIIKWAEYKIEKYEETGTPIPTMPSIPEHEITEDMPEWYQLRDHKRYEAALWHNKERDESAAEFGEKVLAYILQNCVEKDDLNRIVTEEDFRKFYESGLVPQLTLALIVYTLKNSFQAKFNNEDLMEALSAAEGGHGAYNVVRHWENKWATQMQFSDLQLATVPLEERARRICSMNLDEWMSYLEVDRTRRMRNID